MSDKLRPLVMLAGMFALWLVLSACGEVRGERVVSGVTTTEATNQSTAVDRSESATSRPDAIPAQNVATSDAFAFSATELFSRNFSTGTSLVANGPVIITFVVPQCAVCVAEGPELAASAANNPDVTYVFVHSGGTAESYGDYVATSGLHLENIVHLDDSPGRLWARFGVVQQPTSVFLGADGSLSQSLGALGGTQLEQVVAELQAA